jgi:hypothetical protein
MKKLVKVNIFKRSKDVLFGLSLDDIVFIATLMIAIILIYLGFDAFFSLVGSLYVFLDGFIWAFFAGIIAFFTAIVLVILMVKITVILFFILMSVFVLMIDAVLK